MKSIKSIKRYLLHIYQYWTRGFSDEVTWNLDTEVAKFVLPRLKRYKEITLCYPSNLTREEWDEKLDKMIGAFELILRDCECVSVLTKEECSEIEDGMFQFVYWYHCLWW